MSMDRAIHKRLTWVNLYKETQYAALTCRRCGISIPILRKWWRYFQADGIDGLVSQSRRPLHPPNLKVSDNEVTLIVELRNSRNLRVRRTKVNSIGFIKFLATIHKVLTRNNATSLKKIRKKTQFH